MPFLRAGFNFRHRVVARAKVAASGIWSAQLIAFANGGDLAWYCPRRFLEWAGSSRIRVWNLIGDQPGYFREAGPSSPWPKQRRMAA